MHVQKRGSTNYLISLTLLSRWPQVVDEILEDLELPSLRSGGNWFTWPFKVIDLTEIATLREERDAKRLQESG